MAILAAVEESERSRRVLSVAQDLAASHDERLVVVHVIPREDFEAHREALQDVAEFRDFSIDQEAESAREVAAELARETLEPVDGDTFEAKGRVGDVADQILSVADDLDPRYLVIGGQKRSPVGKALFGSTAQELLLRADCPVVFTRATEEAE